MTIDQKTYSLLSAAAGVIAIAPASRIKPQGDWQNLTRPYIVHFPVGPYTTRMHSGRAPLTEWVYQVSCFAEAYSAARALADAVKAALDGVHDDVRYFWEDQSAMVEREFTPTVHHIALTFRVFEAL